jgi:hypothetical protein
MSLKKIFILPVGFILVHVLYIGCCKCIDGNYYREVSSLRALHYSGLPNTSLDTVYIRDTLFSSLQVNFNYITQVQKNPFGQLVNAAYATSCDCNTSDLGYKYPLDSIVITSSKIFNGIPVGANIVSHFKGVYYDSISGLPKYLTVPQLLDSINRRHRFNNIDLLTATLPGLEKIHTLKYTLHSNNKEYQSTARKIAVWQ